MNGDDDRLRDSLTRQVRRLREARPAGLLGLLVTGGTAGLLLAVPLVAGAYLGRWLDEQSAGYSVRWTVNLILLGLAVGVGNVVWFFRTHGK
ncbi:MAG: AtpZ/AtpI family protein [Piscinibacter sp.]|nr:AtpZ/AtpI family protein [Piscinibacter sp.]